MKKKLFFLGIDSATWNLIDSWIDDDKLPGFTLLKKRGHTFNLHSTTPPLTPIAWTSLYTGKNPGNHGIFDFYRIDDDGGMDINLASNAKGKTIFEILSDNKLKTAVLNLPFTYPPKPINGVMLSGFLTPNLNADFIYPANLQKNFVKKFPNYTFAETKRFSYSRDSKREYLKDILESAKQKIEVFNWVENLDDWNFFAVNFMEVDHAQHWFWQYQDKTHPQYKDNLESKEFHNAIYQVYTVIDSYLLKKLNENQYDDYFVFSDHGAGKYVANLNLNALFLKNNLITLKKGLKTSIKKTGFQLGITPSNLSQLALKLNKLPSPKPSQGNKKITDLFLNLNDIDWDKTQAFSFGYYGQIYLLKKEPEVQEKVTEILKNLKYDGKPVINKIWSKEEIYSGDELKNAPDITFNAKNYSFGASSITPFLANTVFSKPHTLKSGEHRPKGIFAMFPKTHFAIQTKDVTIYDVSATILEYFNATGPTKKDGQSIIHSTSEITDIDF